MAAKSPLQRALKPASPLVVQVCEGLGAVHRRDHRRLDPGIREKVADSLDLDEALKTDHPADPRWDYLLGLRAKGQIVAVEPHQAKDSELEVVIRKKDMARKYLKQHWHNAEPVARWIWVASGNVQLNLRGTTGRRLDQAGILFAGSVISVKHLP